MEEKKRAKRAKRVEGEDGARQARGSHGSPRASAGPREGDTAEPTRFVSNTHPAIEIPAALAIVLESHRATPGKFNARREQPKRRREINPSSNRLNFNVESIDGDFRVHFLINSIGPCPLYLPRRVHCSFRLNNVRFKYSIRKLVSPLRKQLEFFSHFQTFRNFLLFLGLLVCRDFEVFIIPSILLKRVNDDEWCITLCQYYTGCFATSIHYIS